MSAPGPQFNSTQLRQAATVGPRHISCPECLWHSACPVTGWCSWFGDRWPALCTEPAYLLLWSRPGDGGGHCGKALPKASGHRAGAPHQILAWRGEAVWGNEAIIGPGLAPLRQPLGEVCQALCSCSCCFCGAPSLLWLLNVPCCACRNHHPLLAVYAVTVSCCKFVVLY